MSSLWIALRQGNLPPLIYACIYHPPGLNADLKDKTVQHIITTICKLSTKYTNAKFCVCGDSNDLNYSAITTAFPLQQIVNFPTRGNNTLDIILTDVDEYIKTKPNPSPPLGIMITARRLLMQPSDIRESMQQ
jgi:hypothetical protein